VTSRTTCGECGIYWCKLPSGNDTIDARDGERDSVTCGVGADTVKADPADVVATDCEQVERGTAVVDNRKRANGKRCVVPKLRGLKLKAAKKKLAKAGCKAKVRKASSRRVRRGKVMGQSAKAGKRLKRGAAVTVTVSRGR
jgi:PASTA domain